VYGEIDDRGQRLLAPDAVLPCRDARGPGRGSSGPSSTRMLAPPRAHLPDSPLAAPGRSRGCSASSSSRQSCSSSARVRARRSRDSTGILAATSQRLSAIAWSLPGHAESVASFDKSLRTAASRIRGAPVLGQSGRARRTPRGAADLARRSPTELVLSLIRSSRSGFLVAPPSAQRAPPRPFLERLHFKTTAAVPARRAALRMEGAQRSTPSAARRAPRAAPPASFASLPTSRASPGAHADALAPLDADVM